MTPDPEAEGTQEPEAVEPSTPEPTPAAPSNENPTPWNDDLAQAFTDEAVRAQVDQFLRSTVQPYVTNLEQATQQDRDARRLWEDFNTRPEATFASVARELFPDNADQLLEVLSGQGGDPEVPENDPESVDFAIDEDELPESVREAVQYIQDQKQEQAFQSNLARVKADNPDVSVKDELFYPFISAAEGDFDIAIENYKEFTKEFKEELTAVPDEITPEPETPPAPPVLNGENAAPTPPVEPQKQTMDEALDDWFAEIKGAPPTV